MARHLIEPAIYMILNYIEANIAPALDAVANDRNTVQGNIGIPTSPPKSYFRGRGYDPFSTPAIIVNCESIDFKKPRGANHINATAKCGVVGLVENTKLDQLYPQAWRYQAALSQILDNLSLTSSDNTFRITIIVQSAEFSEDYTDSTQKDAETVLWRKGVKLMCDVEFYEQL